MFWRRLDAPCQRPRGSLGGNDLPELGSEVRLHILGTSKSGRVARANYLFFRKERRDLLHPWQCDRRIERSQRAENRRIERNVVRLRVELRALASLHHRRTWKSHEDRLREMW